MSDDLDSLVQKTAKNLETSSLHASAAKPAGHRLQLRKLLPLVLLLVIGASTYITMNALTPMATLDDEAIQVNMLQILSQARNAVESNRDESGHPPAVLPNAALANIVFYQIEGDDYLLSMTHNGNTVMRDFDGKFTVNGEFIDE